MKAEERKKLESNTLQKGLETALEGVKQGPSSSFLFWVGGAVLVVLAIVLFRWFLSSAESTASDRWLALASVAFPAQLDKLLEEKSMKDTPQGRLAHFKSARLDLAAGLRDLGSDTDKALDRLASAAKTYGDLLRTAGRVPLLHQEALWGAAKANESLGKYDEAKDLYGRLAKDHKESALGKDAQKQLDRLADPANKEDLAKLAAKFRPRPEGRPN